MIIVSIFTVYLERVFTYDFVNNIIFAKDVYLIARKGELTEQSASFKKEFHQSALPLRFY